MSPHCCFSFQPPSQATLAFLSILATAAAGPVHASPIPFLPFLCPSLATATRSTFIPKTFAPSTVKIPHSKRLPDKYEFRDGVWHRASVWTLYGSTVCQDCTDSASTSTAVETLNSSSLPSVSASLYDIRNSLPPGWQPLSSPASIHIRLVLGLSIALASIIFILIVSCVIQHKSDFQRHNRDVEKTKRCRRPSDIFADTSPVPGEVKVKQKLWARASARWRSKAKHSARFRRGRHTVSGCSPIPNVSQRSLNERSVPNAGDLSSLTSTLETLDNSRSASPHADETASPCRAISISSPSPSISSLPAYDRRLSAVTAKTDSCQNLGCSSSDLPRRFGDSADFSIAHIAVDDKALLARLGELASSPPMADDVDPSGVVETSLQVSAPLWDDDDDFITLSCQLSYTGDVQPTNQSALSSSFNFFPPPPLRRKLMSSYDVDPYSSVINAAKLWPEPPFLEEEASYPPLEKLELMPSAPPLSAIPDAPVKAAAENEKSLLAKYDSSSQQDMSMTFAESFRTSPHPAEGQILP